MGLLFIGTVVADDQNGRVVNIPDSARIIRVTEKPGKNGGGVRIDFLVPLGPPEPFEFPESADIDAKATTEDTMELVEDDHLGE